MRRYAQTALLFLLGGTMLKLALTGAYARYVSDIYLPLLILAGLALVAVAGVTLWRDIRTLGAPGDDDATGPITLGGLFDTVTLSAPERTGTQPVADITTGTDPADEAQYSTVDHRDRAEAAGLAAAEHEGLTREQERVADDAVETLEAVAAINAPTAVFGLVPAPADHARLEPSEPPAPVDPFGGADPHRHRVPTVVIAGTRGGWALLVAALVVAVLSPPALSTDPATRLGTVTARPDLPAIPDGDPASLSLVDYVTHATAGGQALAGRRVRLVGFVLAGPRGEPYLARLTIGCCAAGARPVKVGLTGDLPGLLTPGAWLAVTGTYSDLVDSDPVNGESIPYLAVVEVTDLEPPSDPYER